MGKYFEFFRLAFIYGLKNTKLLIGLNIFLITCLLIFSNLWKIIAARRGITHFDPQQLMWFIALNEWVVIAVPDIDNDMEDDLHSGRLAYQLPRPISYVGTMFCDAMGQLVLNLVVLGLVTFLFTWWLVGVFPFTLATLGATLGLGLLAGVIGVLFRMLIGLSAFWFKDVSPFQWMWEKFLFLLGGLMLPLSVYPKWIQVVASWTPFPAILGGRSALALDFSWSQVMSWCLNMVAWILIGSICVFIAYRRGLKVVTIEGG